MSVASCMAEIAKTAAGYGLPFGAASPGISESEQERLASYPPVPFAPAEMGVRKSGIAAAFPVRSVLVFLFPYYRRAAEMNLSQYAQCVDYHRIVPQYLQVFAEILHRHFPAAQSQIQTDATPVLERYFAWKAGLGVIGRNHCLIHPVYGSYCFIGSIVTDAALPAAVPLAGSCRGCGRCLAACPGNCLDCGDFFSCRSYLTQKKGELSAAEQAILRRSPLLFGCDVCQDVCPHNRSIPDTPIPEFLSPRLPLLDTGELEGLTNRQFKERYGDFAFAWRGKAVLLRNQALRSSS